jgi:hypothetical protein
MNLEAHASIIAMWISCILISVFSTRLYAYTETRVCHWVWMILTLACITLLRLD